MISAQTLRVWREGNRLPTCTDHAIAILAVGRELFFQRRQFGERRIGVDRTVAFARRRGGGELPVRWPAVALVAAAFVAAALLAPSAKFALVSALVPVLVPALALKTLSGGAALVLAWLANRCAVCRSRYGFSRRIGAGLAEFIIAVTPSAAMPFAFSALAGLVCASGRLRAFLRTIPMVMTVAIMTRPALLGPATGPPDLDHLRRRNHIGHSSGGRRVCRRGIASCCRLRRRFNGGNLLLRRFRWCSIDRRDRISPGFDDCCFGGGDFFRGEDFRGCDFRGCGFGLLRDVCERDIRKQPRRGHRHLFRGLRPGA